MNESRGSVSAIAGATALPFDSARLDSLLDEAGMDAAVISSKHNIQYLFGGYRFFFFDHFDAIGVSRYLPVLDLRQGPAGAIDLYRASDGVLREGARASSGLPAVQAAGTSLDAAQLAVEHLAKLGADREAVGVERRSCPPMRQNSWRRAPGVEFVDAHLPLERLRARKTREELDILRAASERVVDSMLAVIASLGRARRNASLSKRFAAKRSTGASPSNIA